MTKTHYHGDFELDSVRVVKELGGFLKNVVEHLEKSSGEVTITLEIDATSVGFDDRTQRLVKENVAQLRFNSQEFD